jgi:hypothetical protein
MVNLTPHRILEAWRSHPGNSLDTYGSDAEVRTRAADPQQQRPKIMVACQWLKDHWDAVGLYIKAQGYEWSLDAGTYELATEAYWQARAIQQLACMWEMERQAGRPARDTSGVVLRQNLVTRYDSMSPRYQPWEGIHFVTLTQAYFDFAHLVWSAFGHWCRLANPEPRAIWDAVTAPIDLGPVIKDDPWLLELIARQLAEPARDFDIFKPDAAGLIAQTVPFFSRAAGIAPISEADPFIEHLSYLLADFSIAHELGHRMAGHILPVGELSDNEYLAREVEADRWGFDLFRASWGWRAEIIASARFDNSAQPLLGQLIFFHTARLRAELAAALRLRTSAVRGRPSSGVGPAWRPLEEERAKLLLSRSTECLNCSSWHLI